MNESLILKSAIIQTAIPTVITSVLWRRKVEATELCFFQLHQSKGPASIPACCVFNATFLCSVFSFHFFCMLGCLFFNRQFPSKVRLVFVVECRISSLDIATVMLVNVFHMIRLYCAIIMSPTVTVYILHLLCDALIELELHPGNSLQTAAV